jgi:hypothetical protein
MNGICTYICVEHSLISVLFLRRNRRPFDFQTLQKHLGLQICVLQNARSLILFSEAMFIKSVLAIFG